MHFVQLPHGALALTHRPKLTQLGAFRAAGATHVVTLLNESEGAHQIRDAAVAAGLAWIALPLRNGDPLPATRDDEMLAALAAIRDIVLAGGRVVIHCSAGIHRTGMIGYALLRQLGHDAATARATLLELREVTADGVGNARLAWGDRLADRSAARLATQGVTVAPEPEPTPSSSGAHVDTPAPVIR